MSSPQPGSRRGSPRRGGGGESGSGSGSGGSVCLTPLSPAAPTTSMAAAGAVFAALPSCLMPEAFTDEGHFEENLQQFTRAARLSGWQTATADNRPYYFALRLKGNALHFFYNTHSITTKLWSVSSRFSYYVHYKSWNSWSKTESCSIATKPNKCRVSLWCANTC